MTRRTTTWWQGVDTVAEEPVTRREPWAQHPVLASALTDLQRAVLAGQVDRPALPRRDESTTDDGDRSPGDMSPGGPPNLARLRPGNGTGNSPGDDTIGSTASSTSSPWRAP